MPYRSAQLKALVADSAPHMGELVAQMLRGIGIRNVQLAHNLSATQAAVDRSAFDLLVLDGNLGESRGLDIVSALRKDAGQRNHATPVIMTCAGPSAALIAAARDAGVNEFLRKPFSAQHLKLRLDAIRNGTRIFVEEAAYTGPDRRRAERPVAEERRSTNRAG